MNDQPLASLLSSLESGSRPKGGVSAESGEVPSLGAEHLSADGSFDFTNIKRIPGSFFRLMRTGHIRRDDILIVKDGATTGKTSFVRDDFPFDEAAVNEHVFCLRVNPKKASAAYVYHFLRSPAGQQAILRDFRGATVGGISRGFADRVHVPVLPLDEQERIGKILELAQSMQQRRRSALNELDALSDAIFLDLFGDPVRNDQSLPTKRLIELVDPDRGISYGIVQRGADVDDGVAVLRISDVVNGEIDPSRVKRTAAEISNKYRRTVLRGGELVISIRGTIGRCAVVPSELAGGNISRELALVPHVGIDTEFLLTLLRCESVQRRIGADVKGVAQRGINLADLRELPVLLPTDEALHEFRTRVTAARRLREAQDQAAATLTEFMNSLRAHAFSGGLA